MSKSSNTASISLDQDFEDQADKELGSGRPWMDKCTYMLMEDLASLEEFVDAAIKTGRCAVDLETEGLNSRVDKKSGLTKSRIVGICLSYHKDYGVYVPIAHLDEGSINLPIPAVMAQINRLNAGCDYLIFHHFKFDGQFLRAYGVVLEDFAKIHDTLLLSYVLDSSRKSQGLKTLSKEFLDRPMIEINELFRDKRMGVAFQTLSPRAALRYAASDGMNTLYLFDYLNEKLNEIDPDGRNGLKGVYDIERRCQIVTMEMERNYCLVDVPYFKKIRVEVTQQLEDLKKAIYKEAGATFNIGSLDQLGDILFNKLKIPYPVQERNAKGGYLVGEEVLNKIKDAKIVGMILKLREREKILGTYIENFLLNVDEDNCCKFQLKQTAADTGRFSSSGGEGYHIDGYSGVNCQNIPAPVPKSKDGLNIRKGILARPGYKLVSIDYSGEELRIAANLSREKKWVDEFLYGKGDLHSVTASVIYGTSPADMMLDENKGKRGIGKSVNFLTLYGGGPGRLSEVAKIPLDEAKGIIEKFYEGVPQLKDWIEKEGRRSRKRGYALTPFGRRRNLSYYFKDPQNRQDIQAGLRRACNGAIQGAGADVIKIALYRVWKYVRNGGYEDEVRILMPIHDEIIYEIREDLLDKHIPRLVEVMKLKDIMQDKLKWPVPFETDAEYGDTLYVDHNYFKEKKKAAEEAAKSAEPSAETPPEEAAVPKPKGDDMSLKSEHKELMSLDELITPEVKPVEDGVVLFSNSDSSPFFDYEVCKTDEIAKRQTDTVWAVLDNMNKKGYARGPRKRIRLIKDNVVVHKTMDECSVDAFLALALNYLI